MVTRARGSTGYTLIEMLMVVSIIGTVAGLGGTLMTQVNRFFIQAKARADLQKEERGIMYNLTRELRQARSSSILIDRAPNQPYYSRITFTEQQGGTVTLYQSGRQLAQTWGSPRKTTILTRDLAFLAFTFPRTDDMTILSVSMTLQTTAPGGKVKTLHAASRQIPIMN